MSRPWTPHWPTIARVRCGRLPGLRALKVWMTMKHAGLSGLSAAIEDNLALARYLADRIRAADDLELMARPSLSIVCFRYRSRDAGSADARDESREPSANTLNR